MRFQSKRYYMSLGCRFPLCLGIPLVTRVTSFTAPAELYLTSHFRDDIPCQTVTTRL